MEKTDYDRPFKVHVSLNSKYQSLLVKGRLIYEQTPRSAFAEDGNEVNLTLTYGWILQFTLWIHQQGND